MLLSHDWLFPLPRTHTGMLLGNGTMGVVVWGGENVLRITFNRADFWDHRGGRVWTDQMNFSSIRTLLEANDEIGLKRAFAIAATPPGEPSAPSLLPLGRIELVFDSAYRLMKGTLNFQTGRLVVSLEDAKKQSHAIEMDLALDRLVLCIQLPSGLRSPQVKRVTAWEYPRVADHLQKISFTPPFVFDEKDGSGWIQNRVAAGDSPLCVGWSSNVSHRQLWLTIDYGQNAEAAKENVLTHLRHVMGDGMESLRTANDAWWKTYWADVPKLDIPDKELSFLYAYGMYKFAGLTHPSGIAAGLQGPWIEEYQMPPWSADYHFNINVQMCYLPAYAGNRLSHLLPLFRLIESWMPTLRQNARKFVGIDDGLVLPHAVDDRCNIIGAFWTGTIDHACTAWVGKMMYDYWQFGGDDDFLRRTAYPFMLGAMRVYEQMLERDAGGRLSLPISVSPEYRGSQMNAWGRNASFQLACIHWLVRALQHCCQVLGESPRPIWAEIQQHLPLACVEGDDQHRRIHLWQGTDLEESHRHHSHLAGLTPFDVIDAGPDWNEIVHHTIDHWVGQGMGLWSGWCMSWAAMIHQRIGNADMAALMLQIWQRVFTNEGHGTLHDCAFPGLTLLGAKRNISQSKPEIMQMDAGMGVTAALLDGMAHTRQGVVHLFTGAPQSWKRVSFERIRVEGAFFVSADRTNGCVQSVQVHSEKGGPFRLFNPWEDSARVHRKSGDQIITGNVLTIPTSTDESLIIRQANA